MTTILMRFYFLLLLILNSTLYGQSKKIKDIEFLMQSVNELGLFNGNIIVSVKGKIIYQKEFGYSDYSKTKKLNRQSTMPIGSIAKEFNSTCILFLIEKGKLQLEDNISKYVTSLPSWANEIQVKHLLQYTSGLPRIFKNSASDYYTELSKLEQLEFKPGTGYMYSNANIFLQEEIIKKITNLSYPEFLEKKVFKKLGIRGGKLPLDSKLSEQMAGSFDNEFKETTFIHGGGEMYFTIDDLYNWVYGLHKHKWITKESLNILSTSFDVNSESSLGNVFTENNEIKVHTHQGSGNNYESNIYYESKDKIIIVLQSNNQNFKLGSITESIVNILAEKPFAVPKKSIYMDIRGKLLDNFQKGVSFYEQIKSSQSDKYDFSNELSDLINTGKYLMRRNRWEDAIKIFELGISVSSNAGTDISNAYLLIGECYSKMQKTNLAIQSLKKALEMNQSNKNAEEMLKRLENK